SNECWAFSLEGPWRLVLWASFVATIGQSRSSPLVPKQKSPATSAGLFLLKGPGDDLLSHGLSAISSARRRFTVLFGMGRGGANALWSPGILEFWKVVVLCIASCRGVVPRHLLRCARL